METVTDTCHFGDYIFIASLSTSEGVEVKSYKSIKLGEHSKLWKKQLIRFSGNCEKCDFYLASNVNSSLKELFLVIGITSVKLLRFDEKAHEFVEVLTTNTDNSLLVADGPAAIWLHSKKLYCRWMIGSPNTFEQKFDMCIKTLPELILVVAGRNKYSLHIFLSETKNNHFKRLGAFALDSTSKKKGIYEIPIDTFVPEGFSQSLTWGKIKLSKFLIKSKLPIDNVHGLVQEVFRIENTTIVYIGNRVFLFKNGLFQSCICADGDIKSLQCTFNCNMNLGFVVTFQDCKAAAIYQCFERKLKLQHSMDNCNTVISLHSNHGSYQLFNVSVLEDQSLYVLGVAELGRNVIKVFKGQLPKGIKRKLQDGSDEKKVPEVKTKVKDDVVSAFGQKCMSAWNTVQDMQLSIAEKKELIERTVKRLSNACHSEANPESSGLVRIIGDELESNRKDFSCHKEDVPALNLMQSWNTVLGSELIIGMIFRNNRSRSLGNCKLQASVLETGGKYLAQVTESHEDEQSVVAVLRGPIFLTSSDFLTVAVTLVWNEKPQTCLKESQFTFTKKIPVTDVLHPKIIFKGFPQARQMSVHRIGQKMFPFILLSKFSSLSKAMSFLEADFVPMENDTCTAYLCRNRDSPFFELSYSLKFLNTHCAELEIFSSSSSQLLLFGRWLLSSLPDSVLLLPRTEDKMVIQRVLSTLKDEMDSVLEIVKIHSQHKSHSNYQDEWVVDQDVYRNFRRELLKRERCTDKIFQNYPFLF